MCVQSEKHKRMGRALVVREVNQYTERGVERGQGRRGTGWRGSRREEARNANSIYSAQSRQTLKFTRICKQKLASPGARAQTDVDIHCTHAHAHTQHNTVEANSFARKHPT